MGMLDGKVAVITGAGGGLGRAHALAMAAEGADVLVNDVAPAREGEATRPAEVVAEEVRKLGRKAAANFDDISSFEGAAALIAQARKDLGRIDILVNNAGILRDKSMKKLTEEHWDQVIRVHLRGTFACSQAAALAFAEQGEGGRIVNTSSIAGLKGNFGQSNYGAAKAGIYGLTRVHSIELAKDDVTVNAIAPVAKTAMTAAMDAVPADMKPELVSPLVVWLASPEAAGVTGRVFGAHGNHYFEYAMHTTDGVDKGAEAWKPAEVGKRLEDIGRFAAAAPVAEDGPGSELVRAVFGKLETAFQADKAKDWSTVMVWKVAGAGEWTLKVRDGKASVATGGDPRATCVVEVGAETLAGIVQGTVDASAAFMKGQVKATKVPDLGKFGKLFVFDATFLASLGLGDAVGGGKKGNGLVNPEAVGLKVRGPARHARPATIAAYAAATNDPNPRYQPGDGQVGSPLFPVTYVMDLFEKAMFDPELGIDMSRVVHGEQEIVYHQPLKAWDLIAPRSQVAAITEKSSGWLVDIDQHLWCDGGLAVEMHAGIFVRGEKRSDVKKEKPPKEERPAAKFTCKATVADDQTERYAAASGDHNPIHLDEAFAKSVGLPGKILHGLCSMAMAVGGIVNQGLGGDPTRLKRVKVRFSKPVLPGDELTTTVWEVSKHDRDVLWGFEVTTQRGDVVLSGGEVEALD